MTISQASTAKIGNKDSSQAGRTQFVNKDAPQGNWPQFNPQPTDHLRGGPPCANYNSQKGCPLPSGHVHNGKKLMHICAFCLFDSATARPHPEFYCRNRQPTSIFRSWPGHLWPDTPAYTTEYSLIKVLR